MKRKLLLSLAFLPLVFTGCQRPCRDVVTETYVHKYGVPVVKDDWSRNGKDGQIIQLKTDGVTVTRSFSQGILNGITTHSFPNSSTTEMAETYEQGILKSIVKNYQSGMPKIQEKFEDNKLKEVVRWYEDGTPASNESYEFGLIASGEYRTPMNVVESRVQNGIGVRVIRGNDGELLFKDTISNGQMTERTSFFPNGDPSAVTPFEQGKVHGTRVTFLVGGLPHTVEKWVNGQQEGATLVYQNGEKVAEVPYLKGQKHGTEYRYRDGKVVVEEVSWKNGVQHGPRKIIADETERTEWYHQGELVSRPTFERMNPR